MATSPARTSGTSGAPVGGRLLSTTNTPTIGPAIGSPPSLTQYAQTRFSPSGDATGTAPRRTTISSPAPDEASAVNWLNIFYAAEWAVFAGFAFYLWYRLARDAWERELEELEEAESAAS